MIKNSYCNEKGNVEGQVITMYKTKLVNTELINNTYKRMHIYPWQMDPPPVNQKFMEYCYTQNVSHIAACTYTKAPILQLTRDLWNTTTLNKLVDKQDMKEYNSCSNNTQSNFAIPSHLNSVINSNRLHKK